MNIRNILYSRLTGNMLARETITEALFGNKCGNGIVKIVDWSPVISVSDALAKPAIDLQCKIVAVQSGTGDPSPTNIRPITGFTGLTLNVNGSEIPVTWQTEAGTVYGGVVDVTTGELTVNVIQIKINTLSWTYASGASSPSGKIISTMGLSSVIDTTERFIMTEMYKGTKVNYTSQVQDNCINSFSNGMIAVRDDVYDNDVNGWLAEYGEEYIYIKVAIPQTYQLTPQAVSLLAGNNTLWCNTGDIKLTYKA